MVMGILMALFVAAEKNSTSAQKRPVRVGIFLAILLAVLCGLLLGSGTAMLKFRQYPWKGGVGAPLAPSGGQAIVDQDEFNFGRMEVTEDGKHEFTITNQGDKTLSLNPGPTSCKCTLSEIKDSELAPGKSTKVTVTCA